MNRYYANVDPKHIHKFNGRSVARQTRVYACMKITKLLIMTHDKLSSHGAIIELVRSVSSSRTLRWIVGKLGPSTQHGRWLAQRASPGI